MKFTAAVLATLPFATTACPHAKSGLPNPHLRERKLAERRQKRETRRANRELQTFDGTVAQAITAAKNDILDLIDDDGGLGPLFVRMGFHDCVGGICDGCIDLSDEDNDGLDEPIEELEDVVDTYANQLTRADIWMLAALTAAEETQDGASFTYSFDYYGREVCTGSATGGPSRSMPGPHLTTEDLLTFFDDNFGFDAQKAVAMMGAHSLGRVRNGNSGFNGRWTNQQQDLDNQFFDFLIDGNSATDDYSNTNDGNDNNQFFWVRGGGGGDNDSDDGRGGGGNDNDDGNGGGQGGLFGFICGGGGPDGPNGRRELQNGGNRLIMLNVDMALIADFDGFISAAGEVSCEVGGSCPEASTFSHVVAYSNSNTQFLEDFRDVFTEMTLVGYTPGACASPPCSLV